MSQRDRNHLIIRAMALEEWARVLLQTLDRVVAIAHEDPHRQIRIEICRGIGHPRKRRFDDQRTAALLRGSSDRDSAANRPAHQDKVFTTYPFSLGQPALSGQAV